MPIKKFIRKLILGYKSSSSEYTNWLRNKGVRVGKDVYVFAPNHTNIDVLHPHMLSIGDNVNMTGPVTILCHDYSTVACKEIGGGLGNVRSVSIGNNVFLGWGCTILAGSSIGNNVIIGAGSIVSGKVEDNSVYAGNPAKRIMSMNDYVEKRKQKQLVEAVQIYNAYCERFDKCPDEKLFGNYKNLWNIDDEKKASDFEDYKAFCKYADELMK